MRWTAGLAMVLLLLTGCSAGAPRGLPDEIVPDYQLGGSYPPPPGVTVVVRDSTARPEPGTYSICYVNAFQTQPGSEWPAELLLRDAEGEPLVDADWPDEHIIDTRQPGALERAGAAIRTCDERGFDAVEFDNLDSYTRSEGQLTLDDATVFAAALVTRTHAAGLAAGQKNTLELGEAGRDRIRFDFAIVEECDQYEECDDIAAVYGDAVIDIEYTDELRRPFAEVCSDAATPAATILRDRDLQPPGSPGYHYERC